MARFQRHIFVCVNLRPPDHPKGCCAGKGSEDVRDQLKAELKQRGLSPIVRANNAGCLDACEHGVTLVIYPEGIWYGGVRTTDAGEIVERTILRGEVIDRLLIANQKYRPDKGVFAPLNRGTANEGTS